MKPYDDLPAAIYQSSRYANDYDSCVMPFLWEAVPNPFNFFLSFFVSFSDETLRVACFSVGVCVLCGSLRQAALRLRFSLFCLALKYDSLAHLHTELV